MNYKITSADIANARKSRKEAKVVHKSQTSEQYMDQLPKVLADIAKSLQKEMLRIFSTPACDGMQTSTAYAQISEVDQDKQLSGLNLKLEDQPFLKEGVQELCHEHKVEILEFYSYKLNSTIGDVKHYDIAFILKFKIC